MEVSSLESSTFSRNSSADSALIFTPNSLVLFSIKSSGAKFSSVEMDRSSFFSISVVSFWSISAFFGAVKTNRDFEAEEKRLEKDSFISMNDSFANSSDTCLISDCVGMLISMSFLIRLILSSIKALLFPR